MFFSFLSVAENDIQVGIIAPYHAQCLKPRKALKDVVNDVKVSVQHFNIQQ
jgi:hypothetical protein